VQYAPPPIPHNDAGVELGREKDEDRVREADRDRLSRRRRAALWRRVFRRRTNTS
jgi:hypothetical protein